MNGSAASRPLVASGRKQYSKLSGLPKVLLADTFSGGAIVPTACAGTEAPSISTAVPTILMAIFIVIGLASGARLGRPCS